jgi:hypothetical protein
MISDEVKERKKKTGKWRAFLFLLHFDVVLSNDGQKNILFICL